MFSIAEMAAYAERHEKLLPFILQMLSEEDILKEEKLCIMYMKAIDKLLRFRLFRMQLIGNFESEKNIEENTYN